MSDRLATIFKARKEFMSLLKKTIPEAMPDNIDPTSKEGQKYLRDIALYGVEEMFEALQHLKNWKAHRKTDVGDEFNREEFLEEMVDAYNYFFSLMIHLGIDEDEFYEAYFKKHSIIKDRLKNGY
jgi:NTP pyrophosphatase (non-canonical NTP hydrolase)